jgi:putative DNA primase/helicase
MTADPTALAGGWQRELLTTSQGRVLPVRDNLVLAISGRPDEGVEGIPELRGVIGFNEFTNTVMKLRATPWGTAAGAWEEHDELLMGEWLTRQHGLPSMRRQTLEEAVIMVAHLGW